MKKPFNLLIIFGIIFFFYFAVATNFTFKTKWALDYFNPLAQTLLRGRFNLSNPGATYDLVYFQGKWYVLWGILPSLILMPVQLVKGQFIPTIYLTVFFASLNVVIVYLLLVRLRKEFFPSLGRSEIYLILLLFAFGTTHFYVGTLGSVWHVSQMVTVFLETLGLYVIFKKRRRLRDYLYSSVLFSITLLGRATGAVMIILPMFLYWYEFFLAKRATPRTKLAAFKKGLVIFGLPLTICLTLLFIYNYLRFQNPFEYGYQYLHEAPHLAQIREKNGIMSFRNIPTNLWYMLLEIPKLSYRNGPTLDFNLNGNSIFFLTPPLLAAFLASPFVRKRKSFAVDPYITSLWLTVVITMLPSLAYYNTGWMQFGFRYSLDITVILIILSLFGMRGRLNFLYILGILFSIAMYVLGIKSLM